MITALIKIASGKDIILYSKHRQTLPLVTNSHNKKKYYFFNIDTIWKYIPFKSSDKKKHRIMFTILNIIRPKYILSMNWISMRESLYKAWTAKNVDSAFIVIQHGAYVGGIVTDRPHKFTKCDVFLTWGNYFTEEFIKNNYYKKVKIKTFGNTIYNRYDRNNFLFKERRTNKILLLPTALDHKNIIPFNLLLKLLKELGFEIFMKEHTKQGTSIDKQGNLKYPKIEGPFKIKRELYPLLHHNDFDFILSDHSSALLDAIFFKNKVLYFDPNNKKEYTTNYSVYLENIFDQEWKTFQKEHFYDQISINNQENLFSNMVKMGNNVIEL